MRRSTPLGHALHLPVWIRLAAAATAAAALASAASTSGCGADILEPVVSASGSGAAGGATGSNTGGGGSGASFQPTAACHEPTFHVGGVVKTEGLDMMTSYRPVYLGGDVFVFYDVVHQNAHDDLYAQKATVRGDFVGAPILVDSDTLLSGTQPATNGSAFLLCWSYDGATTRTLCDAWDETHGASRGPPLDQGIASLIWTPAGYLLLAGGGKGPPKGFVHVMNDAGAVTATPLTLDGAEASLLAPTLDGFVLDLGNGQIQRYDLGFHRVGTPFTGTQGYVTTAIASAGTTLAVGFASASHQYLTIVDDAGQMTQPVVVQSGIGANGLVGADHSFAAAYFENGFAFYLSISLDGHVASPILAASVHAFGTYEPPSMIAVPDGFLMAVDTNTNRFEMVHVGCP